MGMLTDGRYRARMEYCRTITFEENGVAKIGVGIGGEGRKISLYLTPEEAREFAGELSLSADIAEDERCQLPSLVMVE